MAELHIIGQIVGATDFTLPSIFCKFVVETGSNFRLLQGTTAGQTQCDMPPDGEMALLAHPIDVHYAVKGIDGWPRLRLEVYGVDAYGRVELAGYGCCIVPTSTGTHELRCPTWRPSGTLREQFSTFFLGGGPRLKQKEIITAPSNRFRLQTEPSGDLVLQLSVMSKDLARYGVLC